MESEMKNTLLRIGAGLGATWLLLLESGALEAQSCALCYQSAAASGTQFIQALKDGIFILLVPPILISGGIAAMAYRKRNQCSPPSAPQACAQPTAARQHGVDEETYQCTAAQR
jgi:hypothetical protein